MVNLYQVHCSGVIAQALYEIQEQVPARKKAQIAVAFRKIIKRCKPIPWKLEKQRIISPPCVYLCA